MKIFYYDVWTHGTRCFVPFDKELKRLGHETVLIHTGSYKENTPKEEVVNGILCRDISYYNTRFIYKVLKREKPDVLVSLNTKYIWDRANVMACRKLGIKTVFLMHGDFPLGDYLKDAIEAFKPKSKFSNKKNKAFLYLSKIIPNYFYSVLNKKPLFLLNIKLWKIVFSYLRDQYQAMMQPIYTEDLLNDYCLVYSKKYEEYYKEVVNYPKDRIIVVGKPDYDVFYRRIAKNDFDASTYLKGKPYKILTSGKKYALYIENGYPEVKLKGWTDEYRIQHIKNIAYRVKREGYILVVKLHPHTDISKVNLDMDDNTIVLKETDIYALVYHSSFCIVHASTTNEIPILLNKPIVYPKFGASKNAVDYFKDLKVIEYWQNLNDKIPLSINKEAREDYIKNDLVFHQKGSSSVSQIVDVIINN